MTVEAIQPAPPQLSATSLAPDASSAPVLGSNPGKVVTSDFSALLKGGVDSVNEKLIQADATIRGFAIDGSTPIHQVTFELEQARLSFELMLQVRNRVVESYQQLMNMQI